jgi:hypothetical protein
MHIPTRKHLLKVPEECLNSPSECLEDDQYVKLSGPTTFSAPAGERVVWDMGFLRRRVIATENVVLRGFTLQGIVTDYNPYVFFFMFHSNAELLIENCTIEHACGGTDANFFLQSLRLVSSLHFSVAACSTVYCCMVC